MLSPDVNPLMSPQTISTKQRHVRTARGRELVDPVSGEIHAISTIHTVEEKDDAEFVKIFAAGAAAAFDLTRTGQRVFQAVLQEYQSTPMNRGFADAVELYWFGNGLAGRDIGLAESTFKLGLRELLDKGFLAPRSPTTFWVNPVLFFKGDRVAFIKEYRRKSSPAGELEDRGQQRLID